MGEAAMINLSVAAIAATFAYATIVAALAWRTHGARSLRWIVLSMLCLATTWTCLTIFTFSIDRANVDPIWVVAFLTLVAGHWALFRFATELAGGARRARLVGDAMFAITTALQLAIPGRFAVGYVEPTPAENVVHLSMTITTTYLTLASAILFWRAGRGMPAVVRNRSRMLALAAIVLLLAMLGSGIREYPLLLVFAALQVASILLIVFAAVPPRWLRNAWHAPLLRSMLRQLADVSDLTDTAQVRALLLPTIARAASAQRAVMHDLETGEEVGAFGDVSSRDANAPRIRVPASNLELELIGAPHDPFFSVDEQQLVRDLGLHLEAALDRCRMLERERAAAATMSSANVRLQHANAELRELADLRDNFVAIASHELRTPITTIMGFTATLLDLWDRIGDDERRHYLRLVDRDARRMGQLVEDLLLLSSVEAADFRVSRERVAIAPLLEQVVADLGSEAALVQVSVDGVDLAVHADPRHVRQAVGNLLANARKHGAPPIIVRAKQTSDYRIRIAVEDHGPGVPEEFRDQLFARFSRARQAEALPGSGLGLFIVQRLVEVQGGRAWLEDVEPTGARFVIELPAAAPA